MPIIEALWQVGKLCYLPYINSADKKLHFKKYNPGDTLRPNRYHILEPQNTAEEMPATSLDIVIAPLVAFDVLGNRLGTGGGYYDRTFAFLHNKPEHKPLLVGLGFSIQQLDTIPVEKFDVPLDGVVSENMIIHWEKQM